MADCGPQGSSFGDWRKEKQVFHSGVEGPGKDVAVYDQSQQLKHQRQEDWKIEASQGYTVIAVSK